MPGLSYRAAALSDAPDIHALLLELAPEIPLRADTLEREEAFYALTRTCARSGESWVALDEGGRIVGFVLADRTEARRHYAEREVIEVHQVGVAPGHRGQGAFGELMSRLFARLVPVAISVSPQNRFDMPRRLAGLGFRNEGSGGEIRFYREPG